MKANKRIVWRRRKRNAAKSCDVIRWYTATCPMSSHNDSFEVKIQILYTFEPTFCCADHESGPHIGQHSPKTHQARIFKCSLILIRISDISKAYQLFQKHITYSHTTSHTASALTQGQSNKDNSCLIAER